MRFLVYSYELHQETVKNPGKMLRWRFITRFMTKIGSKSGKIPYFHKHRDISGNAFFGTSFARKVLES